MQCTGSALEVFRVFLRLGLTSLGGPVAHIGYYRAELIVRRQWLDEAAFADIVALCQFMPGPASSQTGPDALPEASATPDTGIHRGFASVLLALFLALLLLLLLLVVVVVVLPPLVLATGSHAVGMIAAFYNAGALVFGGGHVMPPLLQASVVTPGCVSNDAVLAG